MPAKSKAQFNFMQALASGAAPTTGGGTGPSPAVAAEFVKGQSPKGLPKKVKAPAKKSSSAKLKAGFDKMHAKKGK